MENIQMNGVNLNTNLPETKKIKKVKQQEDSRHQAKEHCSSKASQAMKNAALGVILAASVITGAKATAIPAKAAEPDVVDNATSVSQQAEQTYTKSELEAEVDAAIAEHDAELKEKEDAMTKTKLISAGVCASLLVGGSAAWFNESMKGC